MPTNNLIKDGAIVENQWQNVAEGETPQEYSIVTLEWWLANKEQCEIQNIGVAFEPEHDPAEVKDDLSRIALFTVNFPKFADGRGYSIARELRENFGYQGEIRAIGDVLQDQLFYMHRVGINAFEIREDRSAEEALEALKDFSVSYQADALGNVPVYRQ